MCITISAMSSVVDTIIQGASLTTGCSSDIGMRVVISLNATLAKLSASLSDLIIGGYDWGGIETKTFFLLFMGFVFVISFFLRVGVDTGLMGRGRVVPLGG